MIKESTRQFESGYLESEPELMPAEKKETPALLSAESYLNELEKLGLPEHIDAYQKVIEISQVIREAGGRALLVGGSVRDILMGLPSKDFDMEVYKLEAGNLEKLVNKFGKVSEVGRAFGVLKISLPGGLDIDVSLPRTDSKIDAGHRGFEVKTNPYMSIEEAARRRDFTINSMAADPLTGEIYDPFGGLKDLRERRLKITDNERFKDDPLRVMRAMQFVGRFGFTIDKNDIPLLQQMADCLQELPKERIGEEWKKLLLKSERPSLGLSAGLALGIFEKIHPWFSDLRGIPQEPDWHPEGDVWVHTLMSVDEAAKIVRRENLASDRALTIMLAVLCHDLGKKLTTEYKEGRIKSYGHEKAGEEPTKKFLAAIGIDNFTRDKVVKLVVHHLLPTTFYIEERVRDNKVSDGAVRRLAKRLHPATIQELVLVSEADHLGRGPFEDPETPDQLLLSFRDFPAGQWLIERARELEVEKSRPADLTRGRDWLNLGYQPGPNIGVLIRLSNELRDEKGFSREMVFQLVDGIDKAEAAIKKLNQVITGTG